jgi:hypothetical protein
MKRAMFSVLVVAVLVGLTGCITQRGPRPTACMGGSCAQAPENGQACNDPGENCRDPGRLHCCRLCAGHGCQLCRGTGRECEGEAVNPGPPSGSITYPYYTTRGPRDFLAKSPTSIGP